MIKSRWLQLLLLTSVYLLGALGIMATGSSSGSKTTCPGLDVRAISLQTPVTPTTDSDFTVIGQILVWWDFKSESEFFQRFELSWKNELTNESGSEERIFRRSCSDTYSGWIFCNVSGDTDLSIPLSLALGINEISVSFSGCEYDLEKSVTVVRQLPGSESIWDQSNWDEKNWQ